MIQVLIGLAAIACLLTGLFFAMGCYSDRERRGRWTWRCVLEGFAWAADWPIAMFILLAVFWRERKK